MNVPSWLATKRFHPRHFQFNRFFFPLKVNSVFVYKSSTDANSLYYMADIHSASQPIWRSWRRVQTFFSNKRYNVVILWS